MPVNLVVPHLGESVVEATVGRWRKAAGDSVAVGEVIVELETEKVNLEVGATYSGVLASIERREGETIKIGEVLAIIEMAATPAVAPGKSPETPEPSAEPVLSTLPAAEPAATAQEPEPRATPSARRLALEKGVDLSQVQPSVPGAPITPADVDRHTAAARPAAQPVVAPTPAPIQPYSAPPAAAGDLREERVRMSRRRFTIATRLVESLRTAAMVTTFNDVDMGAVLDLRRRHQESFRKQHGVSLGIVSFFVKAVIPALRAQPRLNAEIQGDEMVLKHYYNIGIAVGAAEGLVVPVLRDADLMSFGAVEQATRAYARKAEEGTLSLEDLRGGTFTISNGGIFGSLLSTPILNAPQVAILGLHRIEERPVNMAGEIRLRPMMYLALSYDHRIVDGVESVRFLKRIKELVEDPVSLLLQA